MVKGVLAWFARNSVAANLLMWSIVIGGLLNVGAIPALIVDRSGFEIVTISIPFPGADPGAVDEAVCVRVARSLQGAKLIRRVHSTATEGLCYVQVDLVRGAELRKAVDVVKSRMDSIDSFPDGVEEAIVREFEPPSQILSLILSGSVDEWTLARLGEQVRDEITALPGINLVELAGVRPFEISIEVSEESLRRHDLTFLDVVEAVRRSSLDLPGGTVKTRGAEILLRTQGQAYSREEFEKLVLLSRSDGSRLTVGDVAHVSDGFAETAERLGFDGQPALLVNVFQVGRQDVIRDANRIKASLDEIRSRLPAGVHLTVWADETSILHERLGTLLENGRDGLILVLVVLALFLRLRLAAWVALGIPISFLGTLSGMAMLDVSIGLASLVGFIIALGIVVDDALVVGENIWRHRQKGLVGVQAAIMGVHEVAGPVFFAVVTTIVAFAPMLGLPGNMGEGFRVLAIVVILSLTVSLVESLLILPAHLSHLPQDVGSADDRSVRRGWARTAVLGQLLDRFVTRYYLPALKGALGWRGATVALAFALLLVSLGLVVSGRVPFVFFRPVESDDIVVGVTLPQGTPVESTAATLDLIEESVDELRRELAKTGESAVLRHVLTNIGRLPAGGIQLFDEARLAETGPHLGGVTVKLAPSRERAVSTRELAQRLRRIVGTIPDAVDQTFSTSVLVAGKAIDIELAGAVLDDLRLAATELKSTLNGYPGVYDVADSLQAGKREIHLSVTAEAEALGIDLAGLSRQVRQAFYGEEVQRFQRGGHELKVMVRYPENERRFLASLENMRIRTPQGGTVPFAVAGRIRFGRSLTAIDRTNGKWTVRVSAEVDRTRVDGSEILGDLRRSVLPKLTSAHAGLRYSFVGEQGEQRETFVALRRNTLMALFLIYALLAVASGSYVQPFLIMSTIPFGVGGAIFGHAIMGFPLTMWSLMGMVALAGVVVNDGLVLVDFMNRKRQAGLPLAEVLHQAGVTRFRPVILTSITTAAGLAPLLFEESIQAQFLIPIGISLAFGVLFATGITLFLVPVAYSLLEEAKALGGR